MKKHIQDLFEELSQVLFLKNGIFGVLFLLASLVFSPRLFLFAFAAAVIGFVSSRMSLTPKILKDGGLLTINGFFYGAAMASLFQESLPFYVCFVLGALLVPLATKVAYEILQHWKLSPFIVSYVLVVWVFALAAATLSFQAANEHELLQSSVNFLSDFGSLNAVTEVLNAILANIGRLFFLPNPSFGLALLVLVMAFKPRQGLYFLVGTALGTLATYLLAGDLSIDSGFSHYSYSAGLVGLALGSFPETLKMQTILLFCLLSMLLTLALAQLCTHLGLPTLSLPYVVTVWIALLSRSPRLNVSWSQ